MNKLRLVLLKQCPRKCKGCCNKDWDLDALPIVDSYKGYDEVLLTGGEPMLNQSLVTQTASTIRRQNTSTSIYMYTAMSNPDRLSHVLMYLNGLTLTLHNQADFNQDFVELNYFLHHASLRYKAFRLNIFEGIEFNRSILAKKWAVKDNITWIKDAPLPPGETIARLPW